MSAKAALRAFSKSVAAEVGPYNIRCNCLVPGSIDTELWQNFAKRRAGEEGMEVEAWRARNFEALPLRRISSPQGNEFIICLGEAGESVAQGLFIGGDFFVEGVEFPLSFVSTAHLHDTKDAACDGKNREDMDE